MVLTIALVYFVLVTVITAILTQRRVKSSKDFQKSAGGGMNWIMVSFCFMLIPLGSGANMSLWETAASGMGMPAVWWGICIAGVFLPMMMCWFGPWVRKTGCTTIPEILSKMFGHRISLIHSCITVAAWTGIGTAETLATASAIYGLSNGAIPYAPYCILIALALIICYVIFGGVMQLASLNMVNGIVMIVGVFVAVFAVTPYLNAHVGGWDGVRLFYESMGNANLLNALPTSSIVWTNTIIPVLVLHCCACAIAQHMNAPFMAAESDKACRKGLFMAVGINGMSVVPWVVLGCVGVAIPALAKSTPNLIVMDLANLALPKPLVAIIMIALLCSTLSTGGASVMGNASVLVNDIIVPVFKPDMKDKMKLRLLRIVSVGAGLLFLWPALHTPVLFPIFIWCFSFGVPVFVVYYMGLRFRMSKMAAWITILAGMGVNFWWTFWTPGFAIGTFFELNMYPVTLVSFGLGVILSLVLPGKPGWMVQLRRNELEEGLRVKIPASMQSNTEVE